MYGGTSEGMDAAGGPWWTLGEASERADVSYAALEAWMKSGALPFQIAWREGASVRVVRATDLAALVPRAADAIEAEDGPTLGDRALRVGEFHSHIGEGGASDDDGELDVQDGEEPHEAELRREIERLRREVGELRADRGSLQAELRRSEMLREGARSRPVPARMSDEEAPETTRRSERALTAWSAAVAGLAIGLAGAAVWGELNGTVVEAAPPGGAAIARAEVEDPLDVGEDPPAVEDVEEPEERRPEAMLPFGPILDSGDQDAAAAAEPTVEEPNIAGPPPPAFPATLRDVDPTAYLNADEDESSCAFHVLWSDGDPRYRAALGPCIGSHNADGVTRGTHRVDGAACCAHHAFVERMTSATRDAAALRQLLAEAEASRADGVVPPLVRLRAERSAKRFLAHALRAELGSPSWAAAGLDDDSGDHAWALDPEGDPMRLSLASWVRVREDGELRRFELDLLLDEGPDGDQGLAFRWLDR